MAVNNEIIQKVARLQQELDAERDRWLQAYEDANRDKMRELHQLRALLFINAKSSNAEIK